MPGQSSAQRKEYERRINRAMDYIDRNIGAKLTLEELAREAAFSPFHFHRIFTALRGETVSAFVRRVRVERAAMELRMYPDKPVTSIALDCGFGSSAVFARAFRSRFGMTAGEWRRSDCKTESKNRQTESNAGGDPVSGPRYAPPWWVQEAPGTREETVEVRIEDMPSIRAVYVRRQGPYGLSAKDAWDALSRWAGPRGLFGPHTMFFSISHDDPGVTEQDKLRYDACISVGPEVKPDGEVGIVELPARRVARGRYEGSGAGIGSAWGALYGKWLPDSGFVPGDSPAIEIYLCDQGNAPERDHFVMDICIPIVPA